MRVWYCSWILLFDLHQIWNLVKCFDLNSEINMSIYLHSLANMQMFATLFTIFLFSNRCSKLNWTLLRYSCLYLGKLHQSCKKQPKYEKVDNVSKVSALYQGIIMLESNDYYLILYVQVSLWLFWFLVNSFLSISSWSSIVKSHMLSSF